MMFTESLSFPLIYEFSQSLWYRRGKQLEYFRSYVRPGPGARILDIGCGVGTLARFCSNFHYEGFDWNERYIEHARKKYGAYGKFSCQDASAAAVESAGSYDVVMANGILHHLSDPDVVNLLKLSRLALREGGRLVTRDGCRTDVQGPFERWLLNNDRGLYVRSPEQYRALVTTVFDRIEETILTDMMRLPYTLLVLQCTK